MRLAHLSDWHTTSLDGAGVVPFLSKRLLGLVSWRIRRHTIHLPEVLAALFDDLRAQAPDHLAITGDLTNVGLEQEFREAAALLEELAPPDRVSLVPGNHDAYAPIAAERSWDLWADYLVSDAEGEWNGLPVPSRASGAPRHEDFPTLRVRGECAFIGLCSAQPTAPGLATGSLGDVQRERLDRLLAEARERDLCRVVLVHHPIGDDISARRRLVDAPALRDVLERRGAELVLHGHRHRDAELRLAGPEGDVPVLGVRSASDHGSKPGKAARYHVYSIERTADARRFSIALERRGWQEDLRRFGPVAEPVAHVR